MVERKSAERKSQQSAAPWRVLIAVEDVAETGQRVELVADEEIRAAVARVAGLCELPRLAASFDVTRRGADGLHVAGVVSATVGQTCVVTLEPLANEVEEVVDLLFVPPPASAADADDASEAEPPTAKWDDPEPLIGGLVDLGALATEFLILGLDPYPRKPGALFESPQDRTAEQGPFAVLSKLAKG